MLNVMQLKQTEAKKCLTKQEFDELFIKFTVEEPFFCFYAAIVEKIITDKIPTMAVGICRDTKQFKLLANLEWCSTLTKVQLFEVFKHEFLHIILNHLEGRQISKNQKIANLGQDLAINSLLSQVNLPPKMLVPGKPFGNGRFSNFVKSLPFGLTSEQYCRKVEEFFKLNPTEENFPGLEEIGQHDFDQELEEEFGIFPLGDPKDIGDMAGKISEITDKVLEKVPSEIPIDILGKMKKFKIECKVSWQDILRSSIRSHIGAKNDQKHTYMRINKRTPYIFPGKKKIRTCAMAVAIDQSGSVNDYMLRLLFAELQYLAKFIDFDLIPFDSTVDIENIQKIKKGKSVNFRRTRSGGTNFQKVQDYSDQQKKYNLLIIVTDLQDSIPKKGKTQRLWLAKASDSLAHKFRKKGEKLVLV